MSGLPFFTISIDFELFWGVRDVRTLKNYGDNIVGVRQAIPAMLKMFTEHQVHATWATVGFVTFENRKELINYLPTELPGYVDPELDPYPYLTSIGKSERQDPYHFGYSLVRQIQDTEGMELGSHTFSHFYCLEERTNPLAFRYDLEASFAALRRLEVEPKTIVFPRNQYDINHLSDVSDAGIAVFRGNESSYFNAPRSRKDAVFIQRIGRMIDAHVNITGNNFCDVSSHQCGLVNVPSSRFLRPCGPQALETLRLGRIMGGMEQAARLGSGFHLWWHPHNFGSDLNRNLSALSKILVHFRELQENFGMRALTMSEAADVVTGSSL